MNTLSRETKLKALNGLKMILRNEKLFKNIAKQIFESIDEDGNGDLDAQEVTDFLLQTCRDNGTTFPTSESIDFVFKELDTKHIGGVGLPEFSEFLIEIFKEQKKLLSVELDEDEDL